jgi:hypothetical protein
MQNGEDDLHGRLLLNRVFVDRNAATVVNHADGSVGLHIDLNVVTVASQSFVNRVVHDLVNKVVQSPGTGRPNVHAGAFANGFEALKNLNVAGSVFAL